MGVQMLDPAVGFKHLGPVGCSSGARWELPRDVILSRRFEVSEQLVPIVSGDVGKPGGCCDDPEACARPVGIRELALVIVDQELDFSFRAIKGSVHRRLRRGAIVEAWVDSAEALQKLASGRHLCGNTRLIVPAHGSESTARMRQVEAR